MNRRQFAMEHECKEMRLVLRPRLSDRCAEFVAQLLGATEPPPGRKIDVRKPRGEELTARRPRR